MRTVAIVQARMGSSRLPGKVLADIHGETMLGRVVSRLRAARTIDEVVVATSQLSDDDAVVKEADRLGTGVHRGSESDVLERYLGAARAYHADAIVRVTADCPLLDAGVVDLVVTALAREVDYASNTHTRTFPRGLDVEALHRDTLERIGRLGTSASAREHVTAFVMERPELFRVRQVVAVDDSSALRWTVDTADDLALVRMLCALFEPASHSEGTDALAHPKGTGSPGGSLAYRHLVEIVRARPELGSFNAHVIQKPWNHVA
jgi:spore coat polysaccharide biosynthesis protein SpsF (cytidylyltransferase family)